MPTGRAPAPPLPARGRVTAVSREVPRVLPWQEALPSGVVSHRGVQSARPPQVHFQVPVVIGEVWKGVVISIQAPLPLA